MVDDEVAKNRRLQKQAENIYEKTCNYCGKKFNGKGKVPFGVCPDCAQEKYCDRCCQETTYEEYMTYSGLCEECANEIEFGEDL